MKLQHQRLEVLNAENQVQREFLPGYQMNVYGYNGSMPGPTIEVTQGDRVRIIVDNQLPEATTVHWHGCELPVQYDGSDKLTQNPIEPGKSFVYEFDVHEAGTFFYHSHVPMQEAFGSVGWFIVHPRHVFDPTVDRDFGLIGHEGARAPKSARIPRNNVLVGIAQATEFEFIATTQATGCSIVLWFTT